MYINIITIVVFGSFADRRLGLRGGMRAERELDVPAGVATVVPGGRHRQRGRDAGFVAGREPRCRGPPGATPVGGPRGGRERRWRRHVQVWRERVAVGRRGCGGRVRGAGLAVQEVRQRAAQRRRQSDTAPRGEPEDQTSEAAQPRRHCHRFAPGTYIIQHDLANPTRPNPTRVGARPKPT